MEAESDAVVVREIASRVAASYPDVPYDDVVELVTACLDTTSDAPVQNFRFVLAEREARRRLRAGLWP